MQNTTATSMAPGKKPFDKKPIIIIVSLLIMAAIVMAPTPSGLSVAGQRMLGIMAFTVLMWITEAVPYGVSAISLISMTIILLGFAPAQGTSGPVLGTGRAIPLAMSGFVSGGWVFVAAGLFIAAAITSTGLEKRIAYLIIRMVGTKTKSIIAGIIITAFVLTFLIPSVIARAATLVPIVLGLTASFGLPANSKIGKAMLLLAGILPSVTGVGVLTGAAPNPVIVTFLTNAGHPRISYMEWLYYAFPYTVLLGVGLYFLMARMYKFEYDELPGGREYLNKCLNDLGPMSAREKKVSIIMTLTILLWATDRVHHIEASAISVLSVLMLILPYIGVSTWNELYKKVDWTSILLFGAGISMAEIFTKTGADKWLSKAIFVDSGVGKLPVTWLALAIFALVFLVRFGFTSITSCLTAITPAILGFLAVLNNASIPITGIVMGVCLVAQCTAVLPVTSAPAMIAYGAGGFTAKDMIRLSIPLTIIMFGLILLFMFTYWPMIGLWHS
jgi:anion transporter